MKFCDDLVLILVCFPFGHSLIKSYLTFNSAIKISRPHGRPLLGIFYDIVDGQPLQPIAILFRSRLSSYKLLFHLYQYPRLVRFVVSKEVRFQAARQGLPASQVLGIAWPGLGRVCIRLCAYSIPAAAMG
ncbi:hypothetical protein F4803DRAFT_519490 [Xylaria telfairii]|nr:hypothetical protein F4803DRAFT_519490 [Xylaria telfairii]